MNKQNVLIEFKQFISAISTYRDRGNHHKTNLITSNQVVQSSLYLLESLPASREVIFEYFALVFDISVNNYILAINKNPSPTGQPTATNSATAIITPIQNPDDENINDIQEALENLITKGPPAWGTLIASWSLELVGKLSNKYWPTRKMDIGSACNLWLNCTPMRSLLGLIASCFQKLNNVEAEACVETLLATFRKFSPTFDWVVARLGGCFPLKIISQILQCGLKRFCDDIQCHFDSEIGILDYLSFAHEKDLKYALRDLLNDGLRPKTKNHLQIIPYVLKLSLYSEILLQAIVSELLALYDESILETVERATDVWMQNTIFYDLQPSFNNIILKLKSNCSKLLIEIAKIAEIQPWCNDFIECTLLELEQYSITNRVCPLLEDLSKEESKNLLWKSCGSNHFIEQQSAVRLLLLLSSRYPHIYHQTISELLTKSYDINKNGIGALIRVFGGLSGILDYPEIKPGFEMVLENIWLKVQFHSNESQTDCINVIRNLIKLTRLEKSNSSPYLRNQLISNALNSCLMKILNIFDCILNRLRSQIQKPQQIPSTNTETQNVSEVKKIRLEKMDVDEIEESDNSNDFSILATIIMQLLNSIDAGSKTYQLDSIEILKLANLSVKYFFWSLTENCVSQRSIACQQSYKILHRQCNSRKVARSICLRELIEGCLYGYNSLFGGYDDHVDDDIEEIGIPDNEKLININRKQILSAITNRSVLHAGVIGKGLKKSSTDDYNDLSNSIEVNPDIQQLFLTALDYCCVDLDKPNNYEGYRSISLLLVEMVSSDIMYNGLPFPDEEFTKVTMERDLLIRRTFRSCPILWGILGMIAARRPALCFASVLLRALCATFLHQWRAKNVNKTQLPQENEELLSSTKKLLQILSMGQLLPPPLSNLHMIVEYLDAPEIALVLKECVWNYLKDNVPSPIQFYCDAHGLHWRNSNIGKPSPQYVDTLRNIMQKKLPKLGAHYHQMFALPEMDGYNQDQELLAQRI